MAKVILKKKLKLIEILGLHLGSSVGKNVLIHFLMWKVSTFMACRGLSQGQPLQPCLHVSVYLGGPETLLMPLSTTFITSSMSKFQLFVANQ